MSNTAPEFKFNGFRFFQSEEAPVLQIGEETIELTTPYALQADGKEVAPFLVEGAERPLGITRLNPDGSVDTSFAEDGVAFIEVAGTYASIADIAVSADGMITILGRYLVDLSPDRPYFDHDSVVVVAQLNPDGSLNDEFGDGGVVLESLREGSQLAPGYETLPETILVQSDGAILVGSNIGSYAATYTVRRLRPDGSFDESYGAPNIFDRDYLVDFNGYSLELLPDDTLLIGAFGRESGAFAIKILQSGQPDSDFALEPRDDYSFRFPNASDSLAVGDDGKFVLLSNAGDIEVTRYNPDGTIDRTFGEAGTTVIDIYPNNYESVSHLSIAPDGRVIIHASTSSVIGDRFVFVLDEAGNPDVTFSDPGPSVDAEAVFVFTEQGWAVWLDRLVTVYDQELNELGDYGGATFRLSRVGGPQAEDVFSAITGLEEGAFQAGQSLVDGERIFGSVIANSGGELHIEFLPGATELDVNTVLSSIGYENTSKNPPEELQLEWVFSDGQVDDSGSDGALSAVAVQTVHISTFNDAPSLDAVPMIALDAQSQDGADDVTGQLVASDPDDLILTFSIVSRAAPNDPALTEWAGAHGVFRIDPIDGSFSFDATTAAPDNTFVDFFTVQVSDGELATTQVIAITSSVDNLFMLDDPSGDGILVDADVVGEDGWRIGVDNAWLFRAYAGVLGRTPDRGGYEWWSEQIELGNHTLLSMVRGFLWSPEFLAHFDGITRPWDIEPEDFIEHMYTNVFGREPDAAGYEWWVNELESGGTNQAKAVIDMTQSNEFIGLTVREMIDFLI